jgi:hypothetical protein
MKAGDSEAWPGRGRCRSLSSLAGPGVTVASDCAGGFKGVPFPGLRCPARRRSPPLGRCQGCSLRSHFSRVREGKSFGLDASLAPGVEIEK